MKKACAKRKPLSARARRFNELRKQIATEAGLALDHPRVMHSSAIRLQLETLHLRLVEGEAVDSGELMRLSTELRGLTPEAALKVEVIYIDGTFDICPSCGHTQPAVEKPPPALASPVA